MRYILLFPTACYFISTLLGMLCLFAGRTPGYKEDWAVIRLNVSGIGYDLLTVKQTADTNSSGVLNHLEGGVENTVGKLEGIVNTVGDDIAGKLAAELGIHQWYSLHMMTVCEGNYLPNATAPQAALNTTHCTGRLDGMLANVTDILKGQLAIGPAHLSLANLHWPIDLSGNLDVVRDAMDALSGLYVVAIALTGTMMLVLAGLAVFTSDPLGWVPAIVVAVGGGISIVCILIGNIFVTDVTGHARDSSVGIAYEAGVIITIGSEILAPLWAVFVFCLVGAIAATADGCLGWRQRNIHTVPQLSGKRAYSIGLAS